MIESSHGLGTIDSLQSLVSIIQIRTLAPRIHFICLLNLNSEPPWVRTLRRILTQKLSGASTQASHT